MNAERTPEKSDRQIAAGLGVDKNTVNKQRKEMEGTGEIHQLEMNIGANGKEAEERKEIPNATAMVDTMCREQPRHRKPISIFNPSGHFGHPKKRWKRDYTRLYARAAGIREGAARF